MPIKSGKKTPMERRFIEHMARSNDAAYAAAQAGYGRPVDRGREVMKKPAIVEDVLKRQLAILHNDILPLAVETHQKLLRDDKTPAGAKATLIKLAYDRAFGSQDNLPDKPLSECTAAELAERIDRLKSEAANRAQPIIDAQPDSDETDVFG